MQSVSSRIWTRVAVIISYDDNHYTHGHLLDIEEIIKYHQICPTPTHAIL